MNNETPLIVPHIGVSKLAFSRLLDRPGTYEQVGRNIIENNLKIPTGDQMASLLYAAYCSEFRNEPEFTEIRNKINLSHMWIFNQCFLTNDGIYVIKDPLIIDRGSYINKKDLEKSLEGGYTFEEIRFSKDNEVRFAPNGTFNLNLNKSKDLRKDGFVIASYGSEGAEKFSEISARIKSNPRIYGIGALEKYNFGASAVSKGFKHGLCLLGNCPRDKSMAGYGIGLIKDINSK